MPEYAEPLSGVVRPTKCLSESADLLRGNYWPFFGLSIVAMLLASAVPFILIGPGFCAIYLTVMRLERGKRVNFDAIGEGFQLFAPSLAIVAVGMIVPAVLLYILIFGGMIGAAAFFSMLEEIGSNGAEALGVLLVIVLIVVGLVVYAALMLVMQGTTFGLMLLTERRLPAMTCLKLGLVGLLRNIWRLIGLLLLQVLIGIGGYLVCCIGFYFVLPYLLISSFLAYRQMFPVLEPPPIGRE